MNLEFKEEYFTLDEIQDYFNQDISDLYSQDEDDIEYLEQSHFGDLLIEKTEVDHERFRLWRNLDCNITEGESRVEIEYAGEHNNHTWETILNIY